MTYLPEQIDPSAGMPTSILSNHGDDNESGSVSSSRNPFKKLGFARRGSLDVSTSSSVSTNKDPRKGKKDKKKASKKKVHFTQDGTKNKNVEDEDIQVEIHPIEHHSMLDKETRRSLWMSKTEMFETTDQADELCYKLGDPDDPDPYVVHLQHLWEDCCNNNMTPDSPLEVMLLNRNNNASQTSVSESARSVDKQPFYKSRGLEIRLVAAVSRHRDVTIKTVVEMQKSKTYRAGINTGNLQRKYKKLSAPSKLWAQALAQDDAEWCSKEYSDTQDDDANVITAMGA